MSTSQVPVIPLNIKKISKHASRVAAVQVMYQIDMAGGEPAKVLFHLLNYYAETEESKQDINEKFLRKLISHFKTEVDFDNIISEHLTKNGSMLMMSSLAKSLIKVAIIEMMFEKTDIPVIINEYINISKYFLEKKSVSFINAMLDKISKTIERQSVCPENK